MPSLTSELLGVALVVVGLLAVALVVDPQLRATRASNRALRAHRRAIKRGAR